MYNARPDLSFVGPVLDQNCLQRLAVGKDLTVVVLFSFVCLCSSVVYLLIAVLLDGR